MKLAVISLVLIFFAIITIVLGIIKIHTYPGKIAKERNHPQFEAIEVTSLLGLLIFPLWMAALVWAYSGAVVGNLYEGGPAEPDLPPDGSPNKDTTKSAESPAAGAKKAADAKPDAVPVKSGGK